MNKLANLVLPVAITTTVSDDGQHNRSMVVPRSILLSPPPADCVPTRDEKMRTISSTAAAPEVLDQPKECMRQQQQQHQVNSSNESTEQRKQKKTLVLTSDDFELGDLLGSGSFASVFQMKPLHPDLLDHHHQPTEEDTDGCDESLASHTTTTSQQLSSSLRSVSERSLPIPAARRFALKTLSERTLSNPTSTELALQGLKFEAELLSTLPRHPHIVSLVGVSAEDFAPQDPTQGFLVLERLTETLDERLRRWRNRQSRQQQRSWKKATSSLFQKINVFSRNNNNDIDDPEQRIRTTHVGLGIARGMAFLHAHGVLYRDLKPENAGFDAAGNVRLFDFGLARQTTTSRTHRVGDSSSSGNEEEPRLTIGVGSLRYMSPEVYCGIQYGYPTDVYSFAILLWEIISLGKPFEQAAARGHKNTVDHFVDMAFTTRQRPPLKAVRAAAVRELLGAAWDPDPDRRPTFCTVVAALEAVEEHRRSHHHKERSSCPARATTVPSASLFVVDGGFSSLELAASLYAMLPAIKTTASPKTTLLQGNIYKQYNNTIIIEPPQEASVFNPLLYIYLKPSSILHSFRPDE